MSRSNPTDNSPNPAGRWFQWGGKDGSLSYYDKVKKEEIAVPLPFTFIVLDVTKTVRGYNKKLKTGLYSNEIRDTRDERLVVKYFAGGQVVADGLWNDIKDTVTARSGKFAINIYLAFKDVNGFRIGCLQATGCAMSAWFDFEKANGKAIIEKAVVMRPGTKDTSGDVEFIPPTYTLKDVSPETNAAAIELDKELQKFFAGYFKRTLTEKAHASAPKEQEVEHQPEPEPPWGGEPEPPPDDPDSTVPF